MAVKVFDRLGNLRALIEPSDNDFQNKSINGVDIANINTNSPLPIDFRIGDYCYIYGSRYTLNTRERTVQNFKRNIEYSLPFEGEGYKLGRVQFLFLDNFNRFTISDFFLNGKAIDFIRLIVENMNRDYPEDNWKIGNIIDSDIKNIKFYGNNCLDVLNQLTTVENFDTEFFIDGNTISLFRRQSNSGVTLSFGSGIANVVREPQDNTNPVTRLYAYGSNKNLGSNYRLGEPRLRLSGQRYVERFTDELQDVFEQTMIFEDIFPHRIGIISSVTSPLIFSDSLIDFNVNSVLIPGFTAKLTFKTGLLSGYEFEITNFNNTSKTFTIAVNDKEQTVVVPSELLYPQVGDTYVLTDILMPEQYISAAESELKNRAIQWLSDNGSPKEKYTVVCDPIWFKKNFSAFKLGESISLKVTDLNINTQIRIITINRNIRIPYLYGIELAELANSNILVNLITG